MIERLKENDGGKHSLENADIQDKSAKNSHNTPKKGFFKRGSV